MQIALAQFSPKQANVVSNLERITDFAKTASARHAGLLCLPEVSTTGFSWDQKHLTSICSSETFEIISNLSKSYAIAICGSFLTASKSGKYTNTFLYFEVDGSITARYSKVHLFSQFKEDQHVEPGNSIVTATTGVGRVGCSICYDLRFPELFRKCALDGAEIQILPAAFPHPRLKHWRAMVQARAMENQNFIIATNQCGYEGNIEGKGIHYCGHSMVVHPSGEILYEAGEETELGMATIHLSDIGEVRKSMHCLGDRRPNLY
ncbi:MAG: hypothetical protein GWO81_03605 [Verrucomicrobia bacterium]|nr:hypothetical protein [Verrucomicrobiota bacterium]